MTPQCATIAAEAGANAVGMILSPARRHVSHEQARAIVSVLSPSVTRVGVFVDVPPDEVERVAKDIRLTEVQLHGDESPQACAHLQRAGLSVIKAFRIADRVDRDQLARYADVTSAILLDTRVEGVMGGTGRPFPWEAAAGLAPAFRIIVAGGLDADNVTRAIDVVHPFGVDVTSGVETDGRKDPKKVRAFVENVRQWERTA